MTFLVTTHAISPLLQTQMPWHLLKSFSNGELLHRSWLGVGFPMPELTQKQNQVTVIGMDGTTGVNEAQNPDTTLI